MNKIKPYKLLLIIFFLFSIVKAQKVTNLRGDMYHFSKFLTCDFVTTDCTYIGYYDTIVTFNINNNGEGSIIINSIDNIITEITGNEVVYTKKGRTITFYTKKGNRIIWYINNNNKSETISLVMQNNYTKTYSNQ